MPATSSTTTLCQKAMMSLVVLRLLPKSCSAGGAVPRMIESTLMGLGLVRPGASERTASVTVSLVSVVVATAVAVISHSADAAHDREEHDHHRQREERVGDEANRAAQHIRVGPLDRVDGVGALARERGDEQGKAKDVADEQEDRARSPSARPYSTAPATWTQPMLSSTKPRSR